MTLLDTNIFIEIYRGKDFSYIPNLKLYQWE